MSELDSSASDTDIRTSPTPGGVPMSGQRSGGKSGGSKKKKRGRPPREEPEPPVLKLRVYSRSDCFKVEKNLLVYG